MASIHPFRALRYDPERVTPSDVVTQPYDKINVDTRASAFFRDWRRQGIFLQDAQPSIYVYSQTFTVPGTKSEVERRGFIALGRIEDYASGVVFRHEQTLAKPKADRLQLLEATRA